jgi:hypothetical protein
MPGRDKWAATSQEDRGRPRVNFTMSPEAKAMLVELAERAGVSQSELVELYIRRAYRKPRDP